jgi:hypothetical protein
MPLFDSVKHRPARYLPVILLSVVLAAAISRLVGDELVPALMALIQLSAGQ